MLGCCHTAATFEVPAIPAPPLSLQLLESIHQSPQVKSGLVPRTLGQGWEVQGTALHSPKLVG